MRALATFLLVLAIAGTALGLAGVAYSFFVDSGFLVPSLALLVVPWVIWRPVGRLATAEGKAPFEAALQQLEPETANWYDGSGLALDRANGKLLVGGRRELAVYSLSELTEVQFVPESAASASAASARLGGGLFLAFGGRTWQVSGIGQDEAELWIGALRDVAPHALFKAPA